MSIQALFNYLLFLPSVTFGVIVAEIFPWALLFSLAYLRRLDKMTLWLLIMLSASAAVTAIAPIAFNTHAETDVIRSLAAYLNIILIFECVLSLPNPQLRKLLLTGKVLFYSLLVIGVLQSLSALEFLTHALTFFVPRAEGTALSAMGDRGVTLLSSEPARAGMELTFLYILVRVPHLSKSKLIAGDIFFLLYVLLIIKSASAAALSLMVIMLFGAQRPINIMIWSMLTIAGLILPNPELGGRAMILINSLDSSHSFNDIIFFIANESGHRLIAAYSFIIAGFQHPFGQGIGNWPEASILAIQSSNVAYEDFRYFQLWGDGDVISVRAPGVLPNMMLDIGVFGVLFFVYWIIRMVRKSRAQGKVRNITLAILFIKISIMGSLGNPVPWIVAAILLRLATEKQQTTAFQPTSPPLPPLTMGQTGSHVLRKHNKAA